MNDNNYSHPSIVSKKEEWYFEVEKRDPNFWQGTQLPNGRSFIKY